MIIAVDVDNTICTTEGTDYAAAQPRLEVIQRVNDLHDAGHTILIFTARGSGSGLDHRALTASQLLAWGVRHHALIMGKPVFDVLIDDRALHVSDFLASGLQKIEASP